MFNHKPQQSHELDNLDQILTQNFDYEVISELNKFSYQQIKSKTITDIIYNIIDDRLYYFPVINSFKDLSLQSLINMGFTSKSAQQCISFIDSRRWGHLTFSNWLDKYITSLFRPLQRQAAPWQYELQQWLKLLQPNAPVVDVLFFNSTSNPNYPKEKLYTTYINLS